MNATEGTTANEPGKVARPKTLKELFSAKSQDLFSGVAFLIGLEIVLGCATGAGIAGMWIYRVDPVSAVWMILAIFCGLLFSCCTVQIIREVCRMVGFEKAIVAMDIEEMKRRHAENMRQQS